MTPGEAAFEAFRSLASDMDDRGDRHALWQALGGKRGGTRALLDILGLDQSKSNMRVVQRWVSLTGQKRNPPDWAKARMADAALDREIMDAGLEARFDGTVTVSNERRHRTQSVHIDRDNPYLRELLAARRSGNPDSLGYAVQAAFFEAWGPGVAPDARGGLVAAMGDDTTLDFNFG